MPDPVATAAQPWRMFVALPLSRSLAEALAEPAQGLVALASLLRLSDVDHGHLTLHFLGSVEEGRVAGLKPRLQSAMADISSFEVVVESVGAFPSLPRVQVLWAGVEDESGRLLALQQSLGRTLNESGFEVEKRRFSPHLTLARTRRLPTATERRQLEGWMGRWRGHPFGRLPIESVLLMRSQLGRGPVKHTIVERFRLK